MSNKTLFTNINKLYTLKGGVRTLDNLKNNELIEQAYLLVEDGTVIDVGLMSELPNNYQSHKMIDLSGKIITPGLIDSHTHLVFWGNRNDEYTKLLQGKTYMDIYQEGGGIFKTVKLTKGASFDDLYHKAEETVKYMISRGVTTIETKSGYGLDFDGEIKQLNVIKKLKNNFDIDLISTYLGAHAFPKNFKEKSEYIDFMIDHVLPEIKKEDLATFVDVFCEKGVFDLVESERILKAAKKLGFKLKLHADEMYPLGGAGLAAKYGCISADHLLQASKEDLVLMKANNVVATLLPVTSFNLNKPFADMKFMKDNGLIVSLASDYNPGSSPCSDFITMMRIACRVFRILPSEILSMVTINAAKALDLDNKIGSIEKGKQADFVVFNSSNFDDVIINFGPSQISGVYKKGHLQEVKYGD